MEDFRAMRKLVAVTLVLFAFGSYAAGGKGKSKVKEKRFEPVVVSAAGLTGSYRGPSESYRLLLELAPDGTLRGEYVEMDERAALTGIELDGAELAARAVFDDGRSRRITGTVSNRIRNGEVAFGIRLYAVPVDGLGIVDPFFERR